MNKYYLIGDLSTQWFWAIIESSNNHIIQKFDVPLAIGGQFLSDIYSRETVGTNKFVKMNFTSPFHPRCVDGWSISKTEFDRIKRIIELKPRYEEYLKLINL